MSYKFGIKTPGDKDFVCNGLRFATKEETEIYGRDLLSRWFVTVIDQAILESDEPANYVIVNGVMMSIEKMSSIVDKHDKKEKENKVEKRTLRIIASEIRKDWKNVWFGAKPYLDAMSTLDTIEDDYGLDSGKSIVLYFLSNATTWKGEKAREIKKELKKLAGLK